MNDPHVVLINPQSLVATQTKYVVHHGIPPVGMAYIAGALKKFNIKYKAIDCVGLDLKRYQKLEDLKGTYIRGISQEEMLQHFPPNPKYICISSMYLTDWFFIKRLIEFIKEKYVDAIIIVGGENPSSFWKEILAYEKDVNYCVIGEGDETLPELINFLEHEKDTRKVAGIAFRTSTGEVFATPRRMRIGNLDDFKPDWEQFPLDNYFEERKTVRTIGKRSMPIVASRGCTYKCSFCTNENKWGAKYVKRSIESVIDEIKEYKEKYDVEHLSFVDLSASLDEVWFMKLVRAIYDAKIGITWELTSGTRSEFLTRENLKLMKDSGLSYLILAPESGSKKTLLDIKKELNVEHFDDVLNEVLELKINVKTNLIVGLYEQTLTDVIDTYKLALKYAIKGVNDVVIYPYVPFPGAMMHDKMKKDGFGAIRDDIDYERYIKEVTTYSIVAINNPNIKYNIPVGTTSLIVMTLCFIITLIFHPKRIFVFIWNIISKKPVGLYEVAVYQYFQWQMIMFNVHILPFLRPFIAPFKEKK